MNHTIGIRDLRSYGVVMGCAFAFLFGLCFPWMAGKAIPKWPWIVAAVFWALAIIAPKALRGIYKVWMRVGLVLGAINSRIILGIVYFVVLVPLGLILKLKGKDPMRRRKNTETTYREVREIEFSPNQMERPY